MIQSNLNIDEEALVQSYFGGGALGRFLKRAIKDGVEQVTKKASDAVRAFKLSKAIEEEAKKTPVRQELPYITYGKRIQTNNPKVTFNYTGPKHSVKELYKEDGSLDYQKIMQIQKEIADATGGFTATHRIENATWHPTDWNTYLHTKDAVNRAIQAGYSPYEITAVLGHDAGKLVAGEGHGPIGANILKQVFPDMTSEQLVAISEHMEKNPATPMGRAVKGADIAEPNEFRKSVYDEYGLDDIPLIFDPSKGDAQNYLSRHLSRLRARGIDYSDISLFPVSKSPIPKDPVKRQAIQEGKNMAAINSKKTIIVSDDPSKTKNLGFMISHEIDHIKNPTYNDLQQSQDFIRKFFDFTDSELKLTQGDTPRLKITDAEILARGSQIKDYLGFTSANQQMTPKQLQQAVKEYPKETGSDNLTKFFSRVKDWEGLTDFINKYATGIIPISIGYYASENDK